MICLAFYEPPPKNKERKTLKRSLFVSHSRETNRVMSENQACVKNSPFKPAFNLTAWLKRFSHGAVWGNEAGVESEACTALTLAFISPSESHSDTKPEKVWQFRATDAVLSLVNDFVYFCWRQSYTWQLDHFADVKDSAFSGEETSTGYMVNMQQHVQTSSVVFRIAANLKSSDWPTGNMFQPWNYEWLHAFSFFI